jgi:hypothetical protein
MTWKRGREERGVTTHRARDQCKSEAPEAMPPLVFELPYGIASSFEGRALEAS